MDCFTTFKSDISGFSLPERFTFPFYYEPHPISKIASNELQTHIENQKDWKHEFHQIGKMFGVLIVQKDNGEIGYLSAFSGKLADCKLIKGFVPPVFDMLVENSFYLEGEKEINSLNENIKI